MKLIPMILLSLTVLTVLTGCGRQEQPTPPPPSADLHEAIVQGNVEAVRQLIAAGCDLNQKEASSGSSPLITAVTFGRADIARALIEAGADVNSTNNDGSTPLIAAAFFCRTEIVGCLLEHGADKGARNNMGGTALDSVSAPFESVQGVYDVVGAALAPAGLQLDYERIRATRPRIAELLR